MSDHPDLVLDFKLFHPGSVRGPESIIARGTVRDIYDNTAIKTRATGGQVGYEEPVYFAMRVARGNPITLSRVIVTIRTRAQR